MKSIILSFSLLSVLLNFPVFGNDDKEATQFIYKLLKEKKFSDKMCNVSDLIFYPETHGRDSDGDTVSFTIGKSKKWYFFPSDFSFSIEEGSANLEISRINNVITEIHYKLKFGLTDGYRLEKSILFLLDKMKGWQLRMQKKEWFEGEEFLVSTHGLKCQFEID